MMSRIKTVLSRTVGVGLIVRQQALCCLRRLGGPAEDFISRANHSNGLQRQVIGQLASAGQRCQSLFITKRNHACFMNL